MTYFHVFKKMNVCTWFIKRTPVNSGSHLSTAIHFWYPSVFLKYFPTFLVEGHPCRVSSYKYKQIEMYIFFSYSSVIPEVAYRSTPCIFHVIHLGVLSLGVLRIPLSLPRIHCVTIDVSYVISLRLMGHGLSRVMCYYESCYSE